MTQVVPKPEDVFALSPDSRFRVVADEGVLVQQKAAEVLVVNGVGSRILELLDGETTAAGLVDTLVAEYDVDRAVLEQDVREYLAELAEADAVQVVSG